MPDCLFCKIAKGEISSEKIYEDDYTFAFLDNNPGNPGHCLVVPKDHFENLYSIPDEELCRVVMTVKKVALGVKAGMEADGVNLIMNNEPAAGQEVFHFHIHIVPRFTEDGYRWGSHKPYENETAKKRVAEKIRKELK